MGLVNTLSHTEKVRLDVTTSERRWYLSAIRVKGAKAVHQQQVEVVQIA